MQIIKINSKKPDTSAIKKAGDALRTGGLVVYPTDTAYGLGANALDEEALRKMYEAKGRDFSKPTHVVVKNWKMIEELAHTNKVAEKLAKAFLPGPITIILNKKPAVPNVLTADLPTVGIRIPDNPVTKLLSKEVSFPYTTPSANISGGKTPYTITDVKDQLESSNIDLALDTGELPEVKPSTIVDLSGEEIKILRRGPVLQADIEEVLGIVLE